MKVGLSAVVIAQDAEITIGRCLESLRWADEIVVLDGGSRDRTVEIARAAGARVIRSPWPGFPEQRRRALAQARHPWVLSLDADEEVSPELAGEVRNVLRSPDRDGYDVPRRNRFLGRWVRHGSWSRDVQMRLFRREAAGVRPAPVHEGYYVRTPAGRLRSFILHHAHPTLSESFEKMTRYTSLEAEQRARRGRVGYLDLLLRPAATFLRYAIGRGGWRDGARGWLLAGTTAVYKGVLLCMAWERRRRGEDGGA
jgi:glycosyltransferase involved in cell wall biosynthesis